jgi:pilus assembly protein CpaF
MSSPTSVTDQLWEDVRAAASEDGLDPDDDVERVTHLARQAVDQYAREVGVGGAKPLGDREAMVERLVDLVCHYGPLTAAILDPATEEILIEDARVFIVSQGRLRGLAAHTTAAINRHVVDKLLSDTTVSLDPANPFVQAQVLGGTARLGAFGPPLIDEGGISASLRFYKRRRVLMDDLVSWDHLSPAAANFLTLVMWALGTVIVSGRPAAGKTTTLAALLAAIRENHCVRVLEDYPELLLPTPFGRSYRCKPASSEGAPIGLRELIKFVLGMRADCIAVGEVRSSESFELTRAMHAGAGFACTIHAHSATDALEAMVLTALGAGPNINEAHVRRSFASAVDVVVHVERDDPALLAEGDPYRRQVTEIRAMAPQLDPEAFSTEAIFERGDGLGSPLVWTGKLPEPVLVKRLEQILGPGRRLRDVLEGRADLP